MAFQKTDKIVKILQIKTNQQIQKRERSFNLIKQSIKTENTITPNTSATTSVAPNFRKCLLKKIKPRLKQTQSQLDVSTPDFLEYIGHLDKK